MLLLSLGKEINKCGWRKKRACKKILCWLNWVRGGKTVQILFADFMNMKYLITLCFAGFMQINYWQIPTLRGAPRQFLRPCELHFSRKWVWQEIGDLQMLSHRLERQGIQGKDQSYWYWWLVSFWAFSALHAPRRNSGWVAFDGSQVSTSFLELQMGGYRNMPLVLTWHGPWKTKGWWTIDDEGLA